MTATMFDTVATPGVHSPFLTTLSLSTKMQAEFQMWYEPLMEESVEKRLGERKTSTTHSPRVPLPHKLDDRTNGNRESQDVATSEGSWGEGGGGTPTRIPRPPVDAWGTPPAASDRREPSKAVGYSGRYSGATSREGGHSPHGSVGAVGLLPPLTGEYVLFVLVGCRRCGGLQSNAIFHLRQLEPKRVPSTMRYRYVRNAEVL